jgi:glycosyltransferase involved in cell wall biosynthesis
MVRSLAALVRQRRPQVVHAHSCIVHSLLPFLPSRQTRLVFTIHDYGLICPKTTFVFRSGVCDGPRFAKCIACASEQYGAARSVALTSGLNIMRLWHRRVDGFIAVSAPVARACASLAARGGPSIQVIPPFLPDDSFPPSDAQRPAFVPATGEYLMFAGALGAHKGIDVLIEAWAGLDPVIPLVLAGLPSPDMPDHFPDGVIVAKNVPHEDVMRAWANCSIAVVPSLWPDPSPLVALEAMAASRPVVASAVGGLTNLVVDGTTGILVPPGDSAALRAGIRQLLGDPARREAMGRAGRQRAAAFSASALVPRVERLYEEIISGHQHPRRVETGHVGQ